MLSDKLYRGIKRSQPSFITPAGNISSAMFKDENGVSVDRAMQRTENEAIERLKDSFGKRLKGVVSLSEKSVSDAAAVLIPAPSRDNPYHAEIYKNIQKEMLTRVQQLILADSCSLIYIDDSVNWNVV